MRYKNITPAVFLDRPNRFVAHVSLNGETETVHVKNTGRCRELLLPGAQVWLTAPGTPGRKTEYDLVAVRKENGLLINMDSQAPNAVALEWLKTRGYDSILPEYRYGGSRIDFYMERGRDRFLMEVKGCTLEENGIGYFPDAPTERGVRHLRELSKAEPPVRASIPCSLLSSRWTESRRSGPTRRRIRNSAWRGRKQKKQAWKSCSSPAMWSRMPCPCVQCISDDSCGGCFPCFVSSFTSSTTSDSMLAP